MQEENHFPCHYKLKQEAETQFQTVSSCFELVNTWNRQIKEEQGEAHSKERVTIPVGNRIPRLDGLYLQPNLQHERAAGCSQPLGTVLGHDIAKTLDVKIFKVPPRQQSECISPGESCNLNGDTQEHACELPLRPNSRQLPRVISGSRLVIHFVNRSGALLYITIRHHLNWEGLQQARRTKRYDRNVEVVHTLSLAHESEKFIQFQSYPAQGVIEIVASTSVLNLHAPRATQSRSSGPQQMNNRHAAAVGHLGVSMPPVFKRNKIYHQMRTVIVPYEVAAY
jgi:hypothetical protein